MWWEDEWLDAAALSKNTSPWEVTEDLALEGGEESLHARGGAGGGAGLGAGAVAVVLDCELGHFTLTVAVVQDEQGQAGMAQEAPGFS